MLYYKYSEDLERNLKMTRANDFFSNENFGSVERKERRDYLIAYTKRNHEKYGIRQVQVDKMLELSEGLFVSDLKEFFETLPSDFQKAFKSAWRQKMYKQKQKDRNYSKQTVELDQMNTVSFNKLKEQRESELGRTLTVNQFMSEMLTLMSLDLRGKITRDF